MPGLNCYSCPAASGACPIGAFQAVVGSSKFHFSYYITGFLILLGVLLGRFICGFLCPFGWFQELLHKIPTKKFSTKKLKPLTYLKYAVLLVMVILLPAFLVNDVGMGGPLSSVSTSAHRGGWRGQSRSPRQFRHPGSAGQAVYMEARHFADGDCTECRILPSVLQMALPAGGHSMRCSTGSPSFR